MFSDLIGNEALFLFSSSRFADGTLQVLSLKGKEGMNEPFKFTIDLAADGAPVDPEVLLGERSRLTIKSPHGDRYLNGIVAEAELLERRTRMYIYRVVFVAELFLLRVKH